jgi:hypothetical protein
MKRSFTTMLVGAAAVVALAAAGCNKEEKKDPAAGGEAAPGGGAAALPPKTGFAVFPATSKVLGGVNLTSARSSALWTMYKDQLESAMSKEMAEFKTACGFDPFTQLQSIVAGGDPSTEEIVVVAKGVNRGQIKGCAEKLAAKEGKKLSVTDEGNLSHYQVDGGEQVWASWLDDTTVVFAPEKDKDYITKRAVGETGLAEGAEVMALLKNVDTSATLYVVATADAMGQNPAAGMMPGAKGFFASIKLTEGLDIDAGVRFDTPENAKSFAAMVQQQMAMAKGQQVPAEMAGLIKAIEKAVVKQEGNDMVLQLKLTNDDLKQLGAVMQQMGQAFGQMGGGGATPTPAPEPAPAPAPAQ